MNGTGNLKGNGAKAVPRYELIDKDGKVVGNDSNAAFLAAVARCRWPDQEQDEDRTGKGWDIQVAGAE